MAVTGVKIGKNPPRVAGDDLDVERNVTVPVNVLITKAWLTVKASKDDLDADALLQKVITSVANQDGAIVEPGTDGEANLRFSISAEDTAALGAGQVFYFDIQVQTDGGKIETLEEGTIGPLVQGVTDATG